MLGYSVVLNLILAFFNLMPIPPLDGGRIIAMLLPMPLRAKFERIERFGMIIIIVLLVSNSMGKLFSLFINPLLDLLLGG